MPSRGASRIVTQPLKYVLFFPSIVLIMLNKLSIICSNFLLPHVISLGGHSMGHDYITYIGLNQFITQ